MAITRKVTLDSSDIRKLLQDLRQIENKMKMDSDIESILDEAVSYCQSLTPISDKLGNHLAYNTYWEKTSTGYRIVQEGENVAFVEFGTGVVGQNNPHPEANRFGWAYGVGSHIFTTLNGRTGWFYPTVEKAYNNGVESMKSSGVKFTEGQIANQQVYRTGLWLEERLNREVRMKAKWVKAKWSQS